MVTTCLQLNSGVRPQPSMAKTAQPSSRSKNILMGAFCGFAAALVLIGIGLVRFLILRHRGAPLKDISGEDMRVLLFYIGGLLLAGAFVGGLRPLLHSRRRTYGVFAGAGAIAMNFLALSDGVARMDVFGFVLFSVLGAILGLAVAFGVQLARDGSRPPAV